MGECRKDALHVDFDRTLKLEFHGSRVTSDAGLLTYRELAGGGGIAEECGEGRRRSVRIRPEGRAGGRKRPKGAPGTGRIGGLEAQKTLDTAWRREIITDQRPTAVVGRIIWEIPVPK